MSEFKYACPVCGQHISCDSSQAGSVMECPTCFQKITVPQAPASGDQKFILTGSQVVEKRVSTPVNTEGKALPKKKFSAGLFLLLLVLLGAAGAGIYFFGGSILGFRPRWKTADIGDVGAAGSFHQLGGTLTITGSGGDIWGRADAFRFVYLALNGDIVLTARVVKMKDTDRWAKAGLMVRQSLSPGSACAQVFVTPDSGVSLQQRASAGGDSSELHTMQYLHAPCWLRLTRRGNTFTAEESTNGTSWRRVGSTTVNLGKAVYAGLAVCSHHRGALCQAVFDHVAVNTIGDQTGNN